MKYSGLNSFVEALEKRGELIRIKEFVDPVLEITEITDRISKSQNFGEGGKALLFENNGTEFPILINAFGSEKRMCAALGIEHFDDVSDSIDSLFSDLTTPRKSFVDKVKLLPTLNSLGSLFPKELSGKGRCQEVIYNNPDLGILPVLKCWPEDGGKFITLPVVITKDLHTGIRNVGMYRMQVFDKNLSGMHWHMHKVGARHFREYKDAGRKMPVAVVLGGDPVYTYSATAPLPDHLDEFLFAGFLRKQRVSMVRCISQELYVPEDADIVIEGFVDPSEDLIWEGPFGDHTGFYSLADWFPRFHITCITHRKDAVYPTTIVGIPPQEDAWIGKATERIFKMPIRKTILPELEEMSLPFEGVAHNITLVSIRNDFPGHAAKVMNALWGAGQMMFNKTLVVVDRNVNVHNHREVFETVVQNTDIKTGVYIGHGPMDILDHASDNYAYGSKLCFDATSPKAIEGNLPKQDALDSELMELKNIFDLSINSSFIEDGLSIIILGINKEKAEIGILKNKIVSSEVLSKIRFIVITDSFVNLFNYSTLTWYCSSNIDPHRDCEIVNGKASSPLMFIDATRKSEKHDGFRRAWPNVITMNKEIIEQIDNKWSRLGLGETISSPSLDFIGFVPNKGPVVEE